MNVTVAGGTGFLGRTIVRSLVEDGHRVTVLSRRPDATAPAGAKVMVWSVDTQVNQANGGDWQTALVESDAVINLSGAPLAGRRWTESYRDTILKSRIAATRALVKTMLDGLGRPRVFLSASAVGYYGPCGDEYLSDVDPTRHEPGDDFLAGVCRAWEAEAQVAEASGARIVLLRTGLVLGVDGGALPELARPFRLFFGGPLGSGTQWMPWIHADDVAGLVRHLLHHPELAGPVHLTAPSPVRNRTFARELGRVLRRPSVFPAPGFVLRPLLGEMAQALLLSGQRAIPDAALGSGYRFRYGDLADALGQLLG
jgi:hypothetical protein